MNTLELRSAMDEAERITTQTHVSRRDEVRLNYLLAKMASLRKEVPASTEARNCFFADLFNGTMETRTTPAFAAGTQSISYSQGPEGGYLVPQEFHNEVIAGMAQYDPLLDENVCTVVQSKDGSLRPYTVPGLDLSTFAAAKVSETSQQNEQTAPDVTGTALGSYTYRASFGASIELEEDMFEPTQALMNEAFGVGMARGIGADLVDGNGSSAPQGVLTGAVDSTITTGAAGVIAATDIENIFFSLNRFYRSQPKAAWVMADATYELVRKAKDSNNRPLINVVNDVEVLMGKPVRVSPSMPSAAGSTGIVFGDLSRYVVRVSRLSVQRSINTPGYAEKGRALYTGIMRADAKVVDPTAGNVPPIVYATLHS
jgi:HK97 family phage major capsid protein